MPMFRRFGRPGLIGLAARTAVVAGTAGVVGNAMSRRRQQQAEAQQYEQQAAAAPPPASVGPTGSGVDELTRLADLHASGALSDAEFAAAKTQLLGI